MGRLPRRLDVALAGRRLAVIHGGVERINQFVFASTPAGEKRRQIDAAGVDGVIAGHSGIPFTQVIGGRLWHNAGAIGMPANDGTPRVWYSVLTPRGGSIHVAHHALDYDHASAAATMRARSYPSAYAAALATGLWPSCDVLPPAERAARGAALTPHGALWRPAVPLAAD
jgi:hypothetical protein